MEVRKGDREVTETGDGVNPPVESGESKYSSRGMWGHVVVGVSVCVM